MELKSLQYCMLTSLVGKKERERKRKKTREKEKKGGRRVKEGKNERLVHYVRQSEGWKNMGE